MIWSVISQMESFTNFGFQMSNCKESQENVWKGTNLLSATTQGFPVFAKSDSWHASLQCTTNILPKPVGSREKPLASLFAFLLMKKCPVLEKKQKTNPTADTEALMLQPDSVYRLSDGSFLILSQLNPGCSFRVSLGWMWVGPTGLCSTDNSSDRNFSRWICQNSDLISLWSIWCTKK